MGKLLAIITSYVFWYPLVMSMTWIIGGLLFYFRREKRRPPELTVTPLVSILIPCYNESKTIEETVFHLHQINYPNFEVIAINDGSTDETEKVLRDLHDKYEKLKVIHLKKNSGKANALYLGLIASKGEIILGLDADSLLDQDALNFMVPHFTTPNYGERVGAVTGNPRVRNRSSLLARVQLCEFSSIIGLIKRSQRILGKIMTVSGVIVAFRKRALLDCGMWDRDMITEDIGVTWKLQRRFWDVRYEPRALCWMLVPETLSGYWKQRVRWAQGGIEVLIKHRDIFLDWRQRRLIPIYIEELLSIFWSLSWIITTLLIVVNMIKTNFYYAPVFWSGSYLALICLIQFGVAMFIDGEYDANLRKYYLWAIWYPIIYWYFNALVVVRALPKALFKKNKHQFAVWDSPDRGLGT
ncbi:poly-beta-1,6 N-acetyl-D-glucosamine synthase [Heliobacterium chlorum]|uniref:Poly-beta-1,6-N-acetyl-D-glucosamine synthase n=1 Tax=Heliobacterium chlorum TaxID=2698 RepID=A0ABR7T3U6_HELCL|nr:poly-beta-1,6-N-acetyl-D-glucosamine synthase [Heliobacterium chlorum]MBC9784346.1 poly-beta-1,6 N-acetyl-D-glucosamine synthase [Heliobacterium chlorum]